MTVSVLPSALQNGLRMSAFRSASGFSSFLMAGVVLCQCSAVLAAGYPFYEERGVEERSMCRSPPPSLDIKMLCSSLHFVKLSTACLQVASLLTVMRRTTAVLSIYVPKKHKPHTANHKVHKVKFHPQPQQIHDCFSPSGFILMLNVSM